MISLENDSNKSAKPETVKPFCLLSALASERTFINMYSIESRTGKYTVCRRVRATFSPEILEAGAVKGLKWLSSLHIVIQEAIYLPPLGTIGVKQV